MFPRRKLIYFLALNAFLSACVTITILVVYDSMYRVKPELPDEQLKGDARFEIAAVVGVGLPDSEMILIRNTGTASETLSGWQIRDEDGNSYIFGDVNLPANAAIQLRTAPGENSIIDLYWGLSAPVWSSGEAASLIDPGGNVRSIYQVP